MINRHPVWEEYPGSKLGAAALAPAAVAMTAFFPLALARTESESVADTPVSAGPDAE